MKKILTTPISYDQIKDLRIGDTVYLTGMLATCRDSGHRRVVKEKILPENFEFKDGAIFHAGPIVGKDENGKQYMVSVGPTTSRRMESAEADFIEQTGLRLIIGKGGMLEKTTEACKKFGAIHCAFPGGCAVVAAQEVGPLIVSIDTQGNNLFDNNKKIFQERFEKLL